LAEIVTVDEALTLVVAITNVAFVAPAGTATLAGVETAELLSDIATTIPPSGAGAFNVTIPVEVLPPLTLLGLTDKVEIDTGLTVKVAVFVVAPRLAVMVTAVEAVIGVVLTTNVADVAPANTVTLTGTVAMGLLSVNVTIVPPAGAAPLRFTVPFEETPPITVVGLRDIVERTAGITVSVALFVPL
jgi:hypothetical protein